MAMAEFYIQYNNKEEIFNDNKPALIAIATA